MTLNCLTKKTTRRRARPSFAGFSLIEVAIVLGVVAIILGGLWNLLGSVQENYRQDQTVSQVAQVVSNMRDFYKSKSAVDALGSDALTSYLIERNVILSEMIRKRTSPYRAGHLWDGTINATFKISRGSDPSSFFVIEFSGLSQKTCTGLASKLTGDGGPEGLLSAQINGYSRSIPISPENTIGFCGSAVNSVALTYRLRQQ